jgi:conjugative transfer signal peptidase TraF
VSLNAFKRISRACLAITALVDLGWISVRHLRINFSRSLPRGLYRVVAAPPGRGDLVTACPPRAAADLARRRGYLAPGRCPGGVEPLGKRVLALTGDEVTITAHGLAIDGVAVPHSALCLIDTCGRPMPRVARLRQRLAPGEIWLYAPHPRSFDSRYFGPVAETAVREHIVPVWTEKAPR